MSTNDLTRQGVRNLDGKPRNGRRAPASATCFHDWRHARDCIGCDADPLDDYAGRVVHEEACSKCPARRQSP